MHLPDAWGYATSQQDVLELVSVTWVIFEVLSYQVWLICPEIQSITYQLVELKTLWHF